MKERTKKELELPTVLLRLPQQLQHAVYTVRDRGMEHGGFSAAHPEHRESAQRAEGLEIYPPCMIERPARNLN